MSQFRLLSFTRVLVPALFALLLCGAPSSIFAGSPPLFSKIVVFGDSLSDDGNIANRVEGTFGFSYPSGNFNYSDHRFTNSSDTDPASDMYAGTWHEQLAHDFLGLPVATNSLDGGFDFAFGGATTRDGSSERTVISNPDPFIHGQFSITIDNMGLQVDEYFDDFSGDPDALYALWGGSNDLFDDDSPATVSAAVGRINALIVRMANANCRNFLVLNVPPLGMIPDYNGDLNKAMELDVASSSFRDQLATSLAATKSMLAQQGITIQIYPVDVWSLLVRVTAEPGNYGLTNVVDSSQGDSSVDPDEYLFWDDIHPTTAGHHLVASEANRVLSGNVQPLGEALNLSTRVSVGTGENVSIAGFIITGHAPKNVILRAIGPSLGAAGLQDPLADPTLALYDHNNSLIATNDNWRDTHESEIEATGIPPQNDLESAIVATLPPGNYTGVLAGKNGATGVGLVEVYDLDSAADSTLGNISTRGLVGTGENVVISGFIIGSGDDPIVVLRGLGPSLGSMGIANPLADPVLELHNGNGALIASNDDWKSNQQSAIIASGIAPTNDLESAIVASLPPGNYTAILSGKNGATGIGLVESYRLP
jgi:phospholipase/lecithinase/hemolysin